MEEIRSNLKAPGLCEKVRLTLPKFKIRSELPLVEPLKRVSPNSRSSAPSAPVLITTALQMGVEDMFSPDRADFSGITKDVNVYVSAVIQKAFIEVNEEGTEAAAVSSN